jgi:hypothetical protein
MPDEQDDTDMSKLPAPVAAALGLVPTVLDGVRRLPGKAATFPVLAVSSALTVMETARREYDELALRGERFVEQWRGREEPPAAPDAEAPKSEPTPVQEVSTPTRVDTAATPDVVETVEAVAAQVEAPEVTSHDELPLPDYDHMTLGSLRGRLRSLTVEQLVQVRDYEKAHAHRLPVVTLLDNRIAKLVTDPTAEPSPGGEAPVLPSASDAPIEPKAARPAKNSPSPPHGKVRLT